MSLEEKIIQNIHELPENEKNEVLDFIDYLKNRAEMQGIKEWSDFSLTSALHDMDDEDTPYSLDDLKELYA